MTITSRNKEAVEVSDDMIMRAFEGDFEEDGYTYSYDRESGIVARSKGDEVEWLADISERDLWYAVLKDERDNDWGTGSYSIEEARAMAKRMNAKMIAVISEENNDPICIEEIEL